MQTVNLLPQGYAQTERSKRRLFICAAVTAAAVMAMLGLGRLAAQKIEQKQRCNLLLEERLAILKTDRAELASYNRTLQGLAAKYSLIQTVNRNRRWASYLAHLADAANAEIVLTRANISPILADEKSAAKTPKSGSLLTPPSGATQPNEAPDATSPKRLVLMLEGYAASNTDVTRFISALSVHDIFEKITFKGSQTAQINGKPLNKFELECPIRYAPRKRSAPDTHIRSAQTPLAASPTALVANSTTSSVGDRP